MRPRWRSAIILPNGATHRRTEDRRAKRTASLEKKVGKVGQLMAEAKGIDADIATEVTQEVKEAAAEVVDKLRAADRGPQQLVSLRETVSGESFDDKRGWRRIAALLGSTNSPFCR